MSGLFSPSFRGCVALVTALSVVATGPAFAQGGGRDNPNDRIALVRDAEIEALLRDYARPVLRAANIGAERNVEIVLVNDRSFNAFVADSRRIFVTIGALLDSQTPNEITGVLAHETGHIVGGHLARIRQELQGAQTTAVVGLLLGIAAMAAGAAARGRAGDLGQAGAGLAMGTASVAQRTLLAYQRQEENAADRAAVTYLNAARLSGRGMLRTFERLADQMAGLTRLVDPYVQSHPLPRERIANLRELIEASPYREVRDPPALQLRHDLMRAKISGFLERSDQVIRRYPTSDASLPARYARAITAYRFGNLQSALADMDFLIRAQPNNPYFHELKGQALLERGRPREAIAPYRRAVQLSGGNALLRVGLGRALVSTEERASSDEAIRELERGLVGETQSSIGYRFLGIAYARRGDEGRAALATAQGHFLDGNYDYARQSAQRAQGLLPRGSPGWLRADDILTFRRPRGEN